MRTESFFKVFNYNNKNCLLKKKDINDCQLLTIKFIFSKCVSNVFTFLSITVCIVEVMFNLDSKHLLLVSPPCHLVQVQWLLLLDHNLTTHPFLGKFYLSSSSGCF